MSTKEERAQARDLEARAAAHKRARELEAAQATIKARRDEALTELQEVRAKEIIAEELYAREVDPLRAEVQRLTYELNGPPFHLTPTELAPLVGRSRQKVEYWIDKKRGVTPQAEDQPHSEE